MCLELKSKLTRVQTAKRDITVYKVLRKSPTGNMVTPYKEMLIKLGGTYISRLKRENDGSEMIITRGLHSFATLKEAREEFYSWGGDDHIVVKCIIPKGAKYYRGLFGWTKRWKCLSSNKIVYINEIKHAQICNNINPIYWNPYISQQ